MEHKNKQSLRIVYMGTPEFAVAPLRCLVEQGYNVVGVVTMPDKPAGRGYKLQASAVKQYAVEQHLPLLQPEKLKEESFLQVLRAWKADLQVVVAFRMLPEVVWSMPPMGTFNLHASLLPQYRGAAPIPWAVINGERETGVTTFFLKHEIDTGNIILQRRLPIAPDATGGEVHDALMSLGASLVTETVDVLLSGDYTLTPQPESASLKPAPKIFRETCRIGWNQPVQRVYDFIRGLSPYPAAFTEVSTSKESMISLKVFEARPEAGTPGVSPGTWQTDGKTYLKFACADGWMYLTCVQLAGKKPMRIEELLRGYTL